MARINQLPIPDWGLVCPRCRRPLAGLPEHRCGACGQLFNILPILALHRPIPELDLCCPNCGYSLTGLTGSRCPECGICFSLRAILGVPSETGAVDALHLADPLDHHRKKREPTFTSSERPLPEFGLTCETCGAGLAGAADDRCPSCGEPFELNSLTGDREWVAVGPFIPRRVEPRGTLYGAQVPYLVGNQRLNTMYSGRIPFAPTGLWVPREFFLDALYALNEAARPPADFARQPWTCPACQEDVPAGFEICWSCGKPHPDAGESE